MSSMITPKLLFGAVVALWFATLCVLVLLLPDWEKRGQFGDLFGSVKALFSGLAFAALYSSIRLQQSQLEIQQKGPLPAGAPWPAFAPGGEGALQLQRNIDEFKLAGIVVLHNDKLRLEHYARNHSATGRWVSFSLAKSWTSTLAGAAIKDGAISSVDDAVTRYIPELRDSAYDRCRRPVMLLASGQIKLGKIDGWPKIGAVLNQHTAVEA
jgi:hypothetical protein